MNIKRYLMPCTWNINVYTWQANCEIKTRKVKSTQLLLDNNGILFRLCNHQFFLQQKISSSQHDKSKQLQQITIKYMYYINKKCSQDWLHIITWIIHIYHLVINRKHAINEWLQDTQQPLEIRMTWKWTICNSMHHEYT